MPSEALHRARPEAHDDPFQLVAGDVVVGKCLGLTIKHEPTAPIVEITGRFALTVEGAPLIAERVLMQPRRSRLA